MLARKMLNFPYRPKLLTGTQKENMMKNDETIIKCEMLTLAQASDLGLIRKEEARVSLPANLANTNVDEFLIRMYAYQEC